MERFVRSLVVIDSAEFVEPTLLSTKMGARGRGGLFLEGPVHAFVPAILLGLSWLNELWDDAEGDPPDGELREPCDGGGGEGVAVVGSDALGQAELVEEAAEATDRGLKIKAE